MKLRVLFGALWMLVAVAGCTVDASVNAGFGCDECPSGECYMGFCVPLEDDGSGGASAGGGSGGAMSTGMPDASAGAGGTSGGGGSSGSGGSGGGSGDGGSGGSSGNGGSGGGGGDGGSGGSSGSGGGPPVACEPEGETEFCYDGPEDSSTSGRCRAGMHECIGGSWGLCLGQVLPTAERCNNLDDDCDDLTDEEAAGGSCDTGFAGVCASGLETCASGTIQCTPKDEPSPETCDGHDEDCDSEVDEDASVACYPDAALGCTVDSGSGEYACTGVCAAGSRACVGGTQQGCEGAVTPGTEVCTDPSNGVSAEDEDCDGRTDEGCSCEGDAEQPCYGGPDGTLMVGECKAGVQRCDLDTMPPMFGACEGEVLPQPETCMNQGEDDNCNGTPDDVPGIGQPCVVQNANGICRNGTTACASNAMTCVTPSARSETCNGEDDDCDDQIDETFDLQNDEDNCGVCGRPCEDSETCCAGNCVNTKVDETYCGSCDIECGSGLVCTDGDCVTIACDASECADNCALGGPCCRNDGQCGCPSILPGLCN